MVGFETGPIAEGRPNDPLPFNFLHIWVTASSKGEGNLHKKSASKWCNYSRYLHFQQYHLHTLNAQQTSNYVCYGFNGKWCQNCHGKHNRKIGLRGCAIAGCLSRWRQLRIAMVSLYKVSFRSWTVLLLSQAVGLLWWCIAFSSSCTCSWLGRVFGRAMLSCGCLPEKWNSSADAFA